MRSAFTPGIHYSITSPTPYTLTHTVPPSEKHANTSDEATACKALLGDPQSGLRCWVGSYSLSSENLCSTVQIQRGGKKIGNLSKTKTLGVSKYTAGDFGEMEKQ